MNEPIIEPINAVIKKYPIIDNSNLYGFIAVLIILRFVKKFTLKMYFFTIRGYEVKTAGSLSPSCTNFIEIEFTQCLVFVPVNRSPLNS